MQTVKTEDWEKLLNNEIKEVVGCTEPASIAYAVASAREALYSKTEVETAPGQLEVKISLSHDVQRNVSTVNVPIIRKKGAKPAAAAGLYARPDSLNLFPSLNEQDQENIYELLDRDDWLEIEPLQRHGIYVEAVCKTNGHQARAIVSGEHDTVEELTCDGEVIRVSEEVETPEIRNLEHARQLVERDGGALKEITREFITRQGKIYDREGFDNAREAVEEVIRGRMAGDALQIQTITGSGNQGIFTALPLYEQYKEKGDHFLPAALFTVLVQIHLVQQEKRISDLCGLTVRAARSLLAGLLYDRGAEIPQIEEKMEELAESMRGIVCEGAKDSCALKGYLAATMVQKLI
ncbi:MAG: L-serine ammonia-lyase, iron-sulfur-dependent, subunit alpha [bacterium]